MKLLAYAMVLLVVLVPTVSADDAAEPEAATPCQWFYYSFDPVGYHLDLECLIAQLPIVGNR